MNFNFIGDIFFPPSCALCGDSIPSGVICTPCRAEHRPVRYAFLRNLRGAASRSRKRSAIKTRHSARRRRAYDDETLRALIHALKFQGIAAAAAPLAEFLPSTWRGLVSPARLNSDALPLSASARERAGSINRHLSPRHSPARSASLSKNICSRASIIANRKAIPRIFLNGGRTSGDVSRSPTGRATGGGAAPPKIKDLLVDDVTTSGTTFAEAAGVLKSGGARKILALAVAKA